MKWSIYRLNSIGGEKIEQGEVPDDEESINEYERKNKLELSKAYLPGQYIVLQDTGYNLFISVFSASPTSKLKFDFVH